MGSSTKKKHQKKADFQKIKLKVGKKIPKGNAIDTTFKAKKIVIKEQLQNAVEQQDGRVKKDINELISKLKHHSKALRYEAMKNLKASLTAFSELIQPNLNSLINNLSEIFTDSFTPFRKVNIVVLKLVFANIKPSQIIPFFPIIVAHLRCAMSHIVYEVQEDSLCVIDLLICFFPQHLNHFCKHLLQDFLNQISNQISNSSVSASSTRKNGDKRLLSSDPKRKITSLHWYLQVLNRLKSVLKTILGNAEVIARHDEEDSTRTINFDPTKEVTELLCSTRCVTMDDTTNSDNPSDFFEDKNHVRSTSSSLMPLLFDILIEARHVSSVESLEVYQCIAEIIHVLWKVIGKWQAAEKDLTLERWFVRQFGDLFLTHCMTSFPYFGRFNAGECQISVRLNLLLCDIFTCFTSFVKSSESAHLKAVRKYTFSMLNTRERPLGSDRTEVLVSILKKLLLDDSVSNRDILERVLLAFQKYPIGAKCYIHFLQLLEDIATQPGYAHLYKYSDLSAWFAQLPSDLVKADIIPWKLVDVIRRVAPIGQTEFLSNLQLHLPTILVKLNDIRISDGDCSEARRKIIDMLYWIPQIETPLLRILIKLSLKQAFSLSLISHICQVLDSRYQKGVEDEWQDDPTIYFDFLLGLILGSSRKNLMKIENGIGLQDEAIYDTVFVSLLQKKTDKYEICLSPIDSVVFQEKLSELALKSLHSICTNDNFDEILEGYVNHVFEDYQWLPIKCVASLLLLCCETWKTGYMPEKICPPLLEISMLFFEVLVTKKEILPSYLPIVDLVMRQSTMASAIFCKFMDLVTEDLSDETITTIGKMTVLIAKACESHHKGICQQLLKVLKNANEKMVSASLWYAEGHYELYGTHC